MRLNNKSDSVTVVVSRFYVGSFKFISFLRSMRIFIILISLIYSFNFQYRLFSNVSNITQACHTKLSIDASEK